MAFSEPALESLSNWEHLFSISWNLEEEHIRLLVGFELASFATAVPFSTIWANSAAQMIAFFNIPDHLEFGSRLMAKVSVQVKMSYPSDCSKGYKLLKKLNKLSVA